MMNKVFWIFFTVLGDVVRANRINAVTTRYFDCCKPSCAWGDKAPGKINKPVRTCYANGSEIVNGWNVKSGCESRGEAFTCDNQVPFVINDQLSYGFAAAKLRGKNESDLCCSCYELTFTSGNVKGKRMIVQVTNTGYDLQEFHFDLAIPGGGQGIFAGCTRKYSNYYSGIRYGGIKRIQECSFLPKSQQSGCRWRFNWFKNADNPNVIARNVRCPKQLTSLSGCDRV
jgi:hypothetical protein